MVLYIIVEACLPRANRRSKSRIWDPVMISLEQLQLQERLSLILQQTLSTSGPKVMVPPRSLDGQMVFTVFMP